MTRIDVALITFAIVAGTAALAAHTEREFREQTNVRGKTAGLGFIGIVDGHLRMRTRQRRKYTLLVRPLAATDHVYACDSTLDQAPFILPRGDVAEAIRLLKTSNKLHRTYGPAYLCLAHKPLKGGDSTAAQEAFEQYARLAPHDVEGPRNVADTYEMQGNSEWAQLSYKKALILGPENRTLQEQGEDLRRNEEVAELQRLTYADEPISPPDERATEQNRDSAQVTDSFSERNRTVETVAEHAGGAADPDSGQKTKSVANDFWREGLMGILGGRRVWWARLAAVVFFGVTMLGAASQSGLAFRKWVSPGRAPVVAFWGCIYGFAVGYIVYWGIPSHWQWAISVPVVVFFSILASHAAAEIRYRPAGHIVVVDIQEIRAVNRYLAANGRCPTCRSRNLLWYQYSAKDLSSGSAVYIRCQKCGHDDYTEL